MPLRLMRRAAITCTSPAGRESQLPQRQRPTLQALLCSPPCAGRCCCWRMRALPAPKTRRCCWPCKCAAAWIHSSPPQVGAGGVAGVGSPWAGFACEPVRLPVQSSPAPPLHLAGCALPLLSIVPAAGLVSWLVQQLGLLSRQALITGIKKVGPTLVAAHQACHLAVRAARQEASAAIGQPPVRASSASHPKRARALPPLPLAPRRTACARCWRS